MPRAPRRLLPWAVLILTLGVSVPAGAVPPRSLLRVETRYQGAPGLETYPKAQVLFLEDEIGFEVEPDGHTVYTEHDTIKILTARGAEDYGVLARVYQPATEQVEVVQARTLRADGTVLDVLPPSISDRPLFPDSPLYGDLRALRIQFPEAGPGTIVEFRVRTRRAPRPDGRWWAASYVQNPDPVLLSTYTVRVPEATEFSWRAPGVIPGRPRETRQDGLRTLYWEVRDVPALVPEAAAPPTERLLRRIEVTNFPSWPAVGAWFEPRWKAAVAASEGLDIVATGVASTAAAPEARIQALLAWAAARYTVEDALPESWSPHPARDLVDAGTLSPMDMAVLLTALLERVGLQARPVLASPVQLEDLERELPGPEAVGRVVLALADGRGGEWWIDPSSPGELLHEPPGGVQGVGALRLGGGLFATPSSDPDQNLRDIQMDVRVEPEGRAELTMTMASDGLAASLWRSLVRELAETPGAQRDQMLERLFRNLAQGFVSSGRLYSYYFPGTVEAGRPFQLSATLMFGELATPQRGGKAMSMPVPLFGGDRLAGLATEMNRQAPARFEAPFRDDVRVHVTLPEGSEVLQVPGDRSVETPLGSFFSTTRREGYQVWYYSRLVVRKAWVSPEDFPALRSLAEAQTAALTSPLVFTPPARAQEEGSP